MICSPCRRPLWICWSWSGLSYGTDWFMGTPQISGTWLLPTVTVRTHGRSPDHAPYRHVPPRCPWPGGCRRSGRRLIPGGAPVDVAPLVPDGGGALDSLRRSRFGHLIGPVGNVRGGEAGGELVRRDACLPGE